MQEDKEQNRAQAPGEEATSGETLSDVEETEKASDKASDESSTSSPAPSPDGAFDEGQGGDGPKDNPGPM
jgi:hypothetical protein